jgi:hypothetical protein
MWQINWSNSGFWSCMASQIDLWRHQSLTWWRRSALYSHECCNTVVRGRPGSAPVGGLSGVDPCENRYSLDQLTSHGCSLHVYRVRELVIVKCGHITKYMLCACCSNYVRSRTIDIMCNETTQCVIVIVASGYMQMEKLSQHVFSPNRKCLTYQTVDHEVENECHAHVHCTWLTICVTDSLILSCVSQRWFVIVCLLWIGQCC